MPKETKLKSADARLQIKVQGAVQGVGFRPFVYRLAHEAGLVGWVLNSPQGVTIEVEGTPERTEGFLRRLKEERPPLAILDSIDSEKLAPVGFTAFEIRHSDGSGEKVAFVLPDMGTCADCLREVLDPTDRRYRYPFTNCTNCGPRFSIIRALPYDRPNTTMGRFRMCPDCQAEYENPLDRRFHAQPNACPVCGPQLALWDSDGRELATKDSALVQAAAAIAAGQIVAVKGLGGFHLMADARNQDTVQIMRARKRRQHKPLALMYPSLAAVQDDCRLSAEEERLLTAQESPIVLLRRAPAPANRLAEAVSPNNPYLGVMLPYTPLHHLLLRELGFPVVATSGNLSDEPICVDEQEALRRLSDIADLFLVHDRPIARHVDDSVARVILGQPQLLRRARGYAPLPVKTSVPQVRPTLAVGGHLKNAVALAKGNQVFISQHIGDLETVQANQAFSQVIDDFQELYDTPAAQVVHDQHPDYRSTRQAQASGLPATAVQHHHAHVLSCMADNRLDGTVLGVAWDGTGYGPDNTIWGGEFLRADRRGYERLSYLRRFRLPGGEKAIKEPWRSAFGLLHAAFGPDFLKQIAGLPLAEAFTGTEAQTVSRMLNQEINSPLTSSAGRLFDAVAAIVGIRQVVSFEGQAAMELEFVIDRSAPENVYPFRMDGKEIDWQPTVESILQALRSGQSPAKIAKDFHDTLAAMVVAVAENAGLEQVALSGGCFQNAYLLERTVLQLRQAGFRSYWQRQVPTNDGGIALGQALATAQG